MFTFLCCEPKAENEMFSQKIGIAANIKDFFLSHRCKHNFKYFISTGFKFDVEAKNSNNFKLWRKFGSSM